MALRSKQTPAGTRDARAKKFLLLLAPVLVVIVAIQAPGLLKSSSETGDAAPADTTVSVDGGAGAQSVPSEAGVPAEGAPATAAGGTDSVTEQLAATAVAPAQGLEDTDPPPQASEGQLIVFTRFVATDPFVPLISDTSGSVEEDGTTGDTSGAVTDTSSSSSSVTIGTTTTSTSPTTSTLPGGTTTGGSAGTDSGSSGSSTTAVEVKIKVNNKAVVVKVGDTFPSSDPAFELVAVEGGVAKIGLAGGSFSSGIETLDLREGDSVTLISQPDGARFTLELVSIG